MSAFEDQIRRNLLRYIVQRTIFCPITGEVLDMDTCVVILDTDGDPYAAFSQAGWKRVTDTGVPSDQILWPGFSVDESTVKA